ncbi:hypothetical protein M9Y10_031053 [Tritrichomonas musculus]|uniref:Protein kinase domain-containing protein n=1 Tax=Tritrichomonas musculus TaxID=1915356 RepID=A0ABR2H1N5_9EUKA
MKFCGYNFRYGLGGSLNNHKNDKSYIQFPGQSSLDVSSLLSFSTYGHSVWINRNYEAFAVGDNKNGEISSLQKKIFINDTKINLQYKSGKPCKFISAVAGRDYTLYHVSGETSSDPSQLVLAYSKKETIFLNIGKRSPLSLFGGVTVSAVIDTEGSVIIITESVFDSPESEVESVKLPRGEKAVKAACGKESVIVLCESHRVFECSLTSKATNKTFSEVSELSGKKINEISGTCDHFFAISEDCQVFFRGSNVDNMLGLPSDIREVKEFILIESLSKYHVIEASAGTVDSLFRTREGQILGCGWNHYGELMLKSGNKEKVFPPEETKVTSGATFCISGTGNSVVFVGVEPPPNSPNMKIKKFVSSIDPTKTAKVAATSEADEVSELRKSLEMKDQEIFSLKSKLIEKEKRIKELESENRQLRDTKTTERSKAKSCLEIIDTATLDNLKRIKSLGQGATSEVFEVSREERLALKVYYPEVIGSENDDDDDDEGEGKFVFNIENARRFLLEYESIAQLDHANIVKAFGISFGDSTHPPAILLEYCVSNLKKKIKKLTDSERICAIVDLSEAMKEVHSVGIIHRDLKLENILVDEHNKIKVSDFGLCTLMKVDTATMSRTQMTGTLKYMAPELLQERTDYDEKVDVYAFGVVVFQILMKGEFPRIGLAEVISGHQAAIPTSVSEFSSELIKKCWSYKPSDRPSFSEICNILKGNEDKLI